MAATFHKDPLHWRELEVWLAGAYVPYLIVLAVLAVLIFSR